MTSLLVTRVPYMDDEASFVYRVKGKNLLEALEKVHNISLYGFDYSGVVTEEDALRALDEVNGDGCDWVISIMDEESKEMLYSGETEGDIPTY